MPHMSCEVGRQCPQTARLLNWAWSSPPIPCGERCARLQDKLVQLSVAKLLGEALHRIHHNKSISALFQKGVTSKR